MDPFIGEIRLLPYSFSPRDWAPCEGQLLPISQNTALFSILGVVYGGDGKTTFALPNLKGRAVPGVGKGPGLQSWNLGTVRGEDSVTLTTQQLPRHNHRISGLDTIGSTDVPSAEVYLGQDRRGGQGTINFLVPSETNPDTQLSAEALSSTGESQSHENRQPFLSLQFCIALKGVFPNRP